MRFTENLQRHVACPAAKVDGACVRDVLEAALANNPRAMAYLLDDQGTLRQHVAVFINGRTIRDRTTLADPVPDQAEVFVMQALSGG